MSHHDLDYSKQARIERAVRWAREARAARAQARHESRDTICAGLCLMHADELEQLVRALANDIINGRA